MLQDALRPLLETLRIRRSRSGWALATDGHEAVIAVSDTGDLEALTTRAEAMFGCRAADVVGRPVDALIPGGLPAASNGQDPESGPQESTGQRPDGTTFPLGMSVARLNVDGRAVQVVFLWDLTERKARAECLEYQATHDSLTGLPNRVALRGQVEDLVQRANGNGDSGALMVLELDRIREVNDTLGHDTGDILLRSIAARLHEPLHSGDTLARMDGAEFAVLLPQTSDEEARATAKRIVKAMRRPFDVRGLSLQADVTVGMARYPDHGQDVSSLLRKADVAMYVARKKRMPLVVYRPEDDLNSARHLTLKGELQRAIEEDHLVLYYQPKIRASTNRIIGVEALVRWNHPKQGLVFPDEFIPLAEHTGLIRSITRWVMDAAIRQCARWEEDGILLPISVNCSARNLLEEDLPEALGDLLQLHRLSPERLTLEVTETILIEDPERALEVVSLLSNLGISISIDDFGTGYSSLNYLRRLPVQELKIDKSFVMTMDKEEGDAVIVRSIIDLAHNLGLKAIAEGVETGAVWSRLQSLGCDTGQGYFFAKPIPVEVLSQWLRTSAWGFPLGANRVRSGWTRGIGMQQGGM